MKAATRVVMDELRAAAEPTRRPGMARVGINIERAWGISIPHCRRIARHHRGDHNLALQLWDTGVHEARILAAMVEDPAQVTDDQMEAWVGDLDSWDVCDQLCGNLFGHTSMVFTKARSWVRRDEEFVKRAGFVLIAERAARDHDHDDRFWRRWLPVIRRGATDERNYVKKSVNWALREIGKRDRTLNRAAIEEAERLLTMQGSAPRWIARDALRELRSDAVQSRLTD
jgi:3-methyladenine DNA glycosylase AlkD